MSSYRLTNSLISSSDDQYCLLYLAMVTGCTSVGKICGSEVFKVTQTALISLQGNAGDDDRVAEVKHGNQQRNVAMSELYQHFLNIYLLDIFKPGDILGEVF